MNRTNPQLRRDSVKEALEFAELLAKQEIDSIERLHQRTLKALSVIVTGFVFCLGIFGWIGYTNLRDVAVSVAQKQVETEVTRQVQAKLTKEHIEEIVKQQVSTYSKLELEAAIQKDLQSEPIHSEILNAAIGAAKGLVKTKFADRHLNDLQCKAFVNTVAAYGDLDGYSVNVLHNALYPESQNLESDILKCIPRSRLKLSRGQSYGNDPPVDGVGLYYYVNSPKAYVEHLQAAFTSAGIETKLVPNGGLARPEMGDKQPISIWVGSKEIK